MGLPRRAALAAAAFGLFRPALAQGSYPDRPVRMVVPFLAGGSVDILNRVFAHALGRQLGQPVVVENRPGGTTSIGSAYVARAVPDGYTLLGGGDSVELNRYLMATLPYDPDRDLVPIQLLADVPYLLVVNPGVPARTLAELIAHARANPGRLTYASFGVGGAGHLAGELLCAMGGIEALHIPYAGNPPALLDVVAGRVSMMFCTLPVVQAELRAGHVRAIALSTLERLPSMPEVPTLSEAGLPGYECTGTIVLYAPSAVPEPIQTKLLGATRAALAEPDVVRLLEDQGFVLAPLRDRSATWAYVREHASRMAEVIRAAHIRL